MFSTKFPNVLLFRKHILNGAKSIVMRLLFLRSQLVYFAPGIKSNKCRWCNKTKENWPHMLWSCTVVQDVYKHIRANALWSSPWFPRSAPGILGLTRNNDVATRPLVFAHYVVLTNDQIDSVRFKEAFLAVFSEARFALK